MAIAQTPRSTLRPPRLCMPLPLSTADPLPSAGRGRPRSSSRGWGATDVGRRREMAAGGYKDWAAEKMMSVLVCCSFLNSNLTCCSLLTGGHDSVGPDDVPASDGAPRLRRDGTEGDHDN